ncbi:MAG: redox-regulated ATPase YchF [Candidatus Pacearchaeota archaeon]
MLIGIVGKPNVGKSTFFKALTLSEVEIANYPFTTIKPNEGIAYVKVKCVEKEFGIKCKPNYGYCINGWRFLPIKVIDVAGLVPKAHLGRGLGNKFLDDLRQADVLLHIVDASGTVDEEGKPTINYNPINDIKWLEEEIEAWFINLVMKDWENLKRKAQHIEKPLSIIYEKLSGLKIKEIHIKETISKLNLDEKFWLWDKDELIKFIKELRKISKPIVIIANKADMPQSEKNIEEMKKQYENIFVCSAEIELALKEAAKNGIINYIPGESSFEIIKKDIDEKKLNALKVIENYLEKYKTTGVQDAIDYSVFNLLKQIVVYPVENENKLSDKQGNILPDAFLMESGSKVIDLAYKIHEDIGKNFIAAIDVKTKKRLARDYELKHNDIIKILTH